MTATHSLSRPLIALATAVLLSGCMVGPSYQQPSQTLTPEFKEVSGWKQASPADQQPRDNWWTRYDDATLNALMQQAQVNNQTLAQSEARFRQALALTRQSRSELFPSLDASAQVQRSSSPIGNNREFSPSNRIGNQYSTQLSLSWQLDLWGKLRRQTAQNRDQAQASAADLANATLSMQSELAQNYFQLRMLDKSIAIYQQLLKGYQDALTIVNNQYQAGRIGGDARAQAQSQLHGANATRLDLQSQRAQLEHAIALLLGRTPAEFSLAPDPNWQPKLPSIPVGVPSSLLERRPDIAAAERQVAAANEAIGIAIAGYFPDLTLSANGGYRSAQSHGLLSANNQFWGIGPSLSGNLIDFGGTRASVKRSRAAYDETIAHYRQTVLAAVVQVEDQLAFLNLSSKQLVARQASMDAATESARITRNRFDLGSIDFLDVANTEASRLNEQRTLLQLKTQRLVSSVQLIAALGGGWNNPVPINPNTTQADNSNDKSSDDGQRE